MKAIPRLNLLLSFIVVFILNIQLYAQSKEIIKKNATAAYVAPNGSTAANFEISSGAYFFDATKRMGVSNIIKQPDNTYVFKYLGEEQPDAIYETIKEFFAEAGANLDKSKNFNAELSSDVKQMVEQLTNKSEALNFLRTSLYRINEASFNEDINQQVYAELFKTIIIESSKIQQSEINKKETQD